MEPIHTAPDDTKPRLAVFLKKFDCNGDKCKQRVRIISRDSELQLESGNNDIVINGLRASGNLYKNKDMVVMKENAFYTFVMIPGAFIMFNHDSLLYISVAPTFVNKVSEEYANRK